MNSKNWIGLLLLLFGIGFFLQQADLINLEALLSNWWPVILIVVGIIQLTYRTNASALSGVLFLLVGSLLLLGQFLAINVWAYIWPLIFIVAGFVFLFSKQAKSGKHLNREEYLRVYALFSGADVKSHASVFQGGTVTTIFGGAEIDLRNAVITNESVVDITSIFGGVTLFVPENTKVDIKGIPIFGGWEDKTSYRASDAEEGPLLRLNCHPLFGGVEVRN